MNKFELQRCPALTLACFAVPVLLIVRISIIALALVGLIASLTDYLRIKFHHKSVISTPSLACTFALGLSTLAFLQVASLDYGFVRTTFSASAVVVLFGALVMQRDWSESKLPDEITPSHQPPTFLIGSLLISVTLVTLGWQSMIPYVVCLSLAIMTQCFKKSLLKQLTQAALVLVGVFGSWWATGSNSGQFVRSYDQLFRSSYGNGLVTWGRLDNVAATGHSVPGVHWLSEATAGVIAKIPSVSAIDSTFRIIPVFSIVLGFFALISLGEIMGFASRRTWFASATAIALSSGFKITTTGRSWGLVLFLVALNPLMRLWFQTHRSHRANVNDLRLATYVIFCTPLVALAQMPVGVIFVAVSLAIGFAMVIQQRSVVRLVLMMTTIQVTLLLVVRYVLVSSDNTINYTDVRLSLGKVLAFDNLGLYIGSNRLFLTGQAMLSTALLVIMAAGLVATDRKHASHRRALHVVGFITIPTFLVVNVVSTSSDRFFHPAIVILTFVSWLILTDRLHLLHETHRSSRLMWTLKLLVSPVIGLLLIPMILANRLPFGTRKTVMIGIVIGIASIVLFGLWLLSRRAPMRRVTERFLLVNLSCLVLLAHFSHIDGTVGILQSDQRSDQAILGSPEVRDCLNFINGSTRDSSIIGSNWFRIDETDIIGRRQTVSASTELRTFVDGPENVALPTPPWLRQRIGASDGFAQKPNSTDYQLLKESQVEQFLVVRDSKTATDWGRFAVIMYSNSECVVLSLK